MSPRSRRRGGGNRNRQKDRRPDQRQVGPGFWGDVSALPAVRRDVRITDDPPAVARSLGPPPLPGHELIAEAYFAAVYDRAVTMAGAVATAGGLISPEELSEELDD